MRRWKLGTERRDRQLAVPTLGGGEGGGGYLLLPRTRERPGPPPLPPAPAGRPREAVHRGQAARRLPVAGAQGRARAPADPGAARPDRGGERKAGPSRDAEDLRGAQDRRPGPPQPAAGGRAGERLRSAREPVAGREIRAAVTRRGSAPAPAAARDMALDQLCINTIRALAMDAVQRADSGHPGTAMALAPLAYVLWQRHLRYNPANPDWFGRDRFVLSAGHACMLLYSVLYLTGYDLSLEDLKQFRQWGSRTPGHSEHGLTPGVEATTGPLGQGMGNAVGMALARAHLAARRVPDRPSLIIVRAHTAWGSPDKQDTPEAHGAPLGEDEVKLTKQNLGWPSLEPFHVPADALAHWRRAVERGARLEAEWQQRYDGYRAAYPDLAAELERRLAGRLPEGWDAELPSFPTIYVFSHDSIGLGEDGPTHQPVEQLASLRAIPGLTVIRPADAAETVEAWRVAILHRDGPVALVLTRQKVPVIDRARYAPPNGLRLGAYVLADARGGKPTVILIATRSEGDLALGACEKLTAEGIAAPGVSMP